MLVAGCVLEYCEVIMWLPQQKLIKDIQGGRMVKILQYCHWIARNGMKSEAHIQPRGEREQKQKACHLTSLYKERLIIKWNKQSPHIKQFKRKTLGSCRMKRQQKDGMLQTLYP